MLTRKFELEATIKYYKDLEDVWSVELTENDKVELAKAEEELRDFTMTKTRRVKQAQWRGKNCERQCAKDTEGVVVGRSKAVKLGDRYVQVNCQKPPDCLAPPFFSFECKNTKFPKSVAKAMSQAIANAPDGFVGYVWWYDKESRCTYIITTRRNFLDMHFSKGGE